jgi:hypothetical protein
MNILRFSPTNSLLYATPLSPLTQRCAEWSPVLSFSGPRVRGAGLLSSHANKIAFKLREGAENGQHQPPV